MKRAPLTLLLVGSILIVVSPFAGIALTTLGITAALQSLQKGGTSNTAELANHIGAALQATLAGFLLAGVGVGLVVAAGWMHFVRWQSLKNSEERRIDFSTRD